MRALLVFLLVLGAVLVSAKYEDYRNDYRRDSREYRKYEDYNKREYYGKKLDSDELKRNYNKDDSDEDDTKEDFNKSHFEESDEDDDSKYKKDHSDEDDDDSHEEKYYKRGKYSGEKYYKKGKFDSDEKYYRADKDYSREKHYKKDHSDEDDDDSVESHEFDAQYNNDAVYYSKRKLQFHEEKPEEDGFFDDVKAYYQRENYVPNYKEEYKRYNRDDRRRDDSDERRARNDKRYYKERYYGTDKPDGEMQRQIQARDNRENRYYESDDSDEVGRYNWKNDRDRWSPLKPLELPPPEKPHKNFMPTADNPQPPPPSEAAQMARYIVHHSDWTTVATISTLRHIRNYPFVNVLSLSDGPVGEGSGIPYLYMTELDFTPHDLASDRRCSLSMSLAETDYCKQQKLDPEDPRCAHITITGEMYKLKNGSIAAKKAEDALFSRHPVMKTWPKDHNFFFATLKMEQIVLLDYFGGPKYIDVKDYLRVPPTP